MNLENVERIVLVMMENRSFDHVFGHLSLTLPGGPPPIAVDGLKGKVNAQNEIENDTYENDFSGQPYLPFLIRSDAASLVDLPHGRQDAQKQMNLSPATGGFMMDGFAQAYFDDNPTIRVAHPDVLAMLTPQLAPMMAFLARSFCVCDKWFSPIPTDTHPNRVVALSGTTNFDNTSGDLGKLLEEKYLVTDWLTDHNVRWRVYHEEFSFFNLMRPSTLIDGRFRSFDQMALDFQTEPDGSFPQVIIVEPTYSDDPFATHPDDNHPPLPIGPGEAFLLRVYNAITLNPDRWRGTVLIVYHDEHGGFFDHMPPLPIGLSPPAGAAFAPFTTTGPRVAAVIASPLVRPGVPFRGNVDHTSVLRFLAERFAPGEAYSAAVAARHQGGQLESISAALTALEAPVAALPPRAPDLGPVVSVSFPQPRTPKTAGQLAFAAARENALRQHPEFIADRHPEMLFQVAHP